MKNTVNTWIEQIRQDHRRKLTLAMVLAAFVVLVAGVVFWQLHTTGVAMSNEVYCGMEEHVHDENCYEQVLNCGLDESEGHIHDDSCYETVETLVCTDDSEDHVHTEDCYETEQILTCGLEESEGHTHTDDCCEEVLTCQIPEHTHSIGCMADETADVETAADWEATLPEELSDVTAENVVAVAESQIGYTESEKNFILAEDGETRQGYTRYGAWYGNEYGDWDAMFASFCLNYAGVPEEDFPEASGSYAWITELEDMDLYVSSDESTAQPGDLIFFDTDGDGRADSVGIVGEIQEDAEFVVDEETGDAVTTTVVTVIEGDSQNAVRENAYRIDDETITGYGILPEQTAAETAVIADFDENVVDKGYHDGVLTGEKNFLYADDNLVLKVDVAGSVEIPEPAGTENEDPEETDAPSWKDISMEISMAGEDSRSYEEMMAYAGEQDGDLYQLFHVDLTFFYGEDEVDVSACDIRVDAAPTQTLLDAAAPEQDEDALVELGVTVAMLEAQEENIVQLDSADVTSEKPENAALSADISGSDFGIMLLDDADPHFTVQFYANIDQILKQHKEGDTDLTVIETHTENGAELPANNGTTSADAYNTSVVEMVSAGSDGFKLDSENVLTEMYTGEAYEFVLEPDLHSMNKLEVNSDYTLKQIWVLEDSGKADSTDPSGWKTYDVESSQDADGNYTYNISFTNNSSEANDTTIYIAEGSVFRFVYDTTPSDAYITVNMYDYNIGNGTVYAGNSTASGTWTSGTKYMYTAEQGINNSTNYTGSGTKLGFGNNNTGSGLATLTWSNNGYANELNKYNNMGLLGCTFSLVTGLDADGHIVYNSGVNAPNLFNDGDAAGKQTYSNAQLTFDREGDTYTLTAISGDYGENNKVSATNLDTFVNPGGYTSIFTNNFWPMDGVSYDGMDPLFGGTSSVRYFGNTEGNMPDSDDGEDHNSYFGMNFDIEFSYTEDYVGPLEYFFFGDDDMWVFLDDQLVLDIGGVHSSVGEHVDLWDYLGNDTFDENGVAEHTLSVFYTERGSSGSTCYISYTLPTVSSVTPVDDSGSLRVDKVVEGATAGTGEAFTFTLELRDEDGNELKNLYNSIIYTDEEENYVDNSYLLTSGDTFTLKDGWHIVIHNLPAGTVATVTETGADGYSTTWTVDSGEPAGGTVPPAMRLRMAA